SFVSGQYNQQSRAVGIQGELYTEFVNHKKRRSGVQKRYGKRRATGQRMLGQTAIADDTGSGNASSRGVSSLYMDIGDCQSDLRTNLLSEQDAATMDDIDRLLKCKFKKICDFEKQSEEIQEDFGGSTQTTVS
ncbi:hypothetical protein Tco_1026978, partial [Tanacetum coccineum]